MSYKKRSGRERVSISFAAIDLIKATAYAAEEADSDFGKFLNHRWWPNSLFIFIREWRNRWLKS